MRARASTPPRSLRHRRGLPVWLLGRSRSWRASASPRPHLTCASRSHPPTARKTSRIWAWDEGWMAYALPNPSKANRSTASSGTSKPKPGRPDATKAPSSTAI
jgi:hypothetical protein